MLDILEGTPWLVYLLFFYLLAIGLKARKTSTASLYRLFIIPVVFTIWSLYSLSDHIADKIIFWGSGLLVGTLIGWLLTHKHAIHFDREKKLVTLPGTYTTLVLVMAIFFVKYFFGYNYATNPEAKTNILYFGTDLAVSGIITGMFVGRLITYISKYFRNP